MPEHAPDQKLANEAALIGFHLQDFVAIYLNAYQETGQENAKLCSILQEYELTIRAPAQAIRQTMLNRLSVAGRADLPTTIASSVYAHPKDVNALFSISEDLMATLKVFDKEKHVEANAQTEQWIVPLIRSPVPLNKRPILTKEGTIAK